MYQCSVAFDFFLLSYYFWVKIHFIFHFNNQSNKPDIPFLFHFVLLHNSDTDTLGSLCYKDTFDFIKPNKAEKDQSAFDLPVTLSIFRFCSLTLMQKQNIWTTTTLIVLFVSSFPAHTVKIVVYLIMQQCIHSIHSLLSWRVFIWKVFLPIYKVNIVWWREIEICVTHKSNEFNK